MPPGVIFFFSGFRRQFSVNEYLTLPVFYHQHFVLFRFPEPHFFADLSIPNCLKQTCLKGAEVERQELLLLQ